MKKQPEINVIDINTGEHLTGEDAIMKVQLTADQTKVLSSLWGALDESVITGHESGNVARWDIRNSETSLPSLENKVHKGQINDMQYNKDQTLFITASKDNTAKVIFLTDYICPLPLSNLLYYSFLTPTHWST